ncbi:MAG: LapA family protein [Deltaproteobacteria bacterium]|nr:LapA family protein [Deltaproteobacteria bacterium]
MKVKLISVIVVLFVFALFVVQNAQVVTVSFLFWKIEASRAIVLMATFVLGMISGLILTRIFKRKNQENHSPGRKIG